MELGNLTVWTDICSVKTSPPASPHPPSTPNASTAAPTAAAAAAAAAAAPETPGGGNESADDDFADLGVDDDDLLGLGNDFNILEYADPELQLDCTPHLTLIYNFWGFIFDMLS